MLHLRSFFLGGTPIVLLAVLPIFLLKNRRLRFCFIVCAIFFGALAAAKAFPPHYVAPMTGVILLGLLSAAQWLRTRPHGRFLLTTLCTAVILEFAVHVWRPPSSMEFDQRAFAAKRTEVLKTLDASPGSHLVFVSYAPDHNLRDGWIYNAADIDRSRIVWAHDMDASGNQELIGYYPGRKVWVLKPDGVQAELRPYRPTF
jgi:hypothetical protein